MKTRTQLGLRRRGLNARKKAPNAGAPSSGPQVDTTLSTREAGEEEAPRAEREGSRESERVCENGCVSVKMSMCENKCVTM